MAETVLVGEAVAGESSKVCEKLEHLVNSIHSSNFDLAELLYQVKVSKFYYNRGYDTFHDYVRSLHLKVPKASYLVKLVEVTRHPKVNRTRMQYEGVGLTKLREITSLDPEELSIDIVQLIEKGASMTLGEIREAVKRLKGLVEEDELVWRNFRIKRSVEETVVKPALELAKRVIGSTKRDAEGNAVEASDGVALEFIASQFTLDPNWGLIKVEDKE
jgi:hypothetical protein